MRTTNRVAIAAALLLAARAGQAQSAAAREPETNVAAAQQPAPQPPGQPAPPRTPAAPQPPQPPNPPPGARGPAQPNQPRAVVEPPPAPPQPEGQAVNIKVDVTITEQRSGASGQKKSVTVITGDGQTGSIRSQSNAIGAGFPIPLHVDATPRLLTNGKLRLRLNLQYNLVAAVEGTQPPRGTATQTDLSENLNVILDDGKPLIAAQSADPIGDRQVTVEVKATVLK